MVEMKVQGLFFDSETNQSVVVLKDEATGRSLPIWVGLFEANAITMGIEHTWTPRPMTHDLMRNIIEGMNAVVKEITVNDLRSNTFYAIISLEVGGRLVEIDSRPSDAIALALRGPNPPSMWTKRYWNRLAMRSRRIRRNPPINGLTIFSIS